MNRCVLDIVIYCRSLHVQTYWKNKNLKCDEYYQLRVYCVLILLKRKTFCNQTIWQKFCFYFFKLEFVSFLTRKQRRNVNYFKKFTKLQENNQQRLAKHTAVLWLVIRSSYSVIISFCFVISYSTILKVFLWLCEYELWMKATLTLLDMCDSHTSVWSLNPAYIVTHAVILPIKREPTVCHVASGENKLKESQHEKCDCTNCCTVSLWASISKFIICCALHRNRRWWG